MLTIRKLIIHCSASDDVKDDSISAITSLHVSPKALGISWGKHKTHGKGFSSCGYHFYISKKGYYEEGRDENIKGAHCYNHNHDSIGICVGGDREFSESQIETLKYLIEKLCVKYCLNPNKDVYPHSHFNELKTCPNFELPRFEEWPERDTILTGDLEE